MPATTRVKSSSPAVAPASESDANWVFKTLTLAFAADPPTRWIYPDPQQYLDHFPTFAKAFGGGAIAQGTAFVSEGYAGAALWLPPGAAPDEEALAGILAASIADRKREDAFAVFEEMARYHPAEPHWYLPLIGVDPARQGQGHGSAMMRAALELCDQSRLCAYLEATSPQNVRLYARHGFETVGEIRVGRFPLITPMLRQPQGRD